MSSSPRGLGQQPCADAQERSPEPTKEEFCARFKARLLKIAGPVDGEGDSVAEYADEVAPTYYDEECQRAEGPEACAETDHSYWEEG